MSAKSIRKCKACLEPVKGHKGKVGIGNCTRKVEDVNDTNVTSPKEDIKETGKRNIVAQIETQEKESSVKPTEEHSRNRSGRLPTEIMDSSFDLPEFLVEKRKESERIRLESSSDCMVDVRTLIVGRRFVICLCFQQQDDQVEECTCPGEVQFGGCDEGCEEVADIDFAVVENFDMFRDPVSEQDLRPSLHLTTGSWEKDEPNVLRLVVSVAAKGASMEGMVVLTAFRVVELTKGRKWLSTRLVINFSGIGFRFTGSRYTKKGIKKKVYMDEMKADLFEISNEEPLMVDDVFGNDTYLID